MFPAAIYLSVGDRLLYPNPVHYVTKHLQQGIESDHFSVKKTEIGGFQSIYSARPTIARFEAMLWLRKAAASLAIGPTVIRSTARAPFGLQTVNKA